MSYNISHRRNNARRGSVPEYIVDRPCWRRMASYLMLHRSNPAWRKGRSTGEWNNPPLTRARKRTSIYAETVLHGTLLFSLKSSCCSWFCNWDALNWLSINCVIVFFVFIISSVHAPLSIPLFFPSRLCLFIPSISVFPYLKILPFLLCLFFHMQKCSFPAGTFARQLSLSVRFPFIRPSLKYLLAVSSASLALSPCIYARSC